MTLFPEPVDMQAVVDRLASALGLSVFRGGDGPLHISRAKAEHKMYNAFLRAGQQGGFEITPDHNGRQQEGLRGAQSFIHDGVRWSASRAYLRPAMSRPNLTVLPKTLVLRILSENGVATGIEITGPDGPRRVTCEREVIVCAGAVSTPRLLLLSGIGPADELREVGVDAVADVPGVGRNLQNHPGVDLQFAIRHEDSLTAQLTLAGRAKLGAEWLLLRKGLGTTNFFETGAFLPTRDNVDYPNMQFEFLPLTRQLRNGKLVPVPGFQFWMDLSRPHSRGYVRLRSKNPSDAPLTVFNHYESRQDLTDRVDGIRLTRERLVRQPAWQQFLPQELSPGPGVVSEGRLNAVPGLRVADASIMPRVITGNLNAPVIMMAEKISDRILGRQSPPPSDAMYHRPRVS